MRNSELLDMLMRCYALNEDFKASKNLMEKIKIIMDMCKLRDQIISQVDNSILSFKELYILLKLFEEKRNREIQFETHLVVFEEDEFEDSSKVNTILVRKVNKSYHKRVRFLVIDPCYEDIKFGNEKYFENITVNEVSNGDVSLFLKQFKSHFKRDYELFAELVISYLMYEHL